MGTSEIVLFPMEEFLCINSIRSPVIQKFRCIVFSEVCLTSVYGTDFPLAPLLHRQNSSSPMRHQIKELCIEQSSVPDDFIRSLKSKKLLELEGHKLRSGWRGFLWYAKVKVSVAFKNHNSRCAILKNGIHMNLECAQKCLYE